MNRFVPLALLLSAVTCAAGCGDSEPVPLKPPDSNTTKDSLPTAQQVDAPMPNEEPTVTVYLNPLMVLLAGKERQKGSPLTEAEVLAVRDSAASIQMTEWLSSEVPVHRMNPDRIWEEWQEIREEIEW